MTDLGDPRSVSKRTKDLYRSSAARAEMYKAIMGLRQGRDFIAYYLERCHVNSPSFSVEALKMAFLEGERNIGLQILADVTSAAPELYAQMLREQGEADVIRHTVDARTIADGADAASDAFDDAA